MSSDTSVETTQEGSLTTESEVQAGEFACRLLTTKEGDGWFDTTHVLYLPLAYCEQRRGARNFQFCDEEGNVYRRLTIHVIDSEGEVLFTADDWRLQSAYSGYRRGLAAKKLEDRLAALQQRLDAIPTTNKPDDHPIYGHINQFKHEVRMYQEWWGRGEKNLVTAQELLGRIEHEIDQLEKSDPVELAIERLFAPDGRSSVHRLNLSTIAAINAASIRTGGFIDAFDEELLRDHYRSVLSMVPHPLMCSTNSELLLSLEDFAPADVLDDPELEVAPTQVAFESNKGEVLYDVSYGFVNGVPTAVVRLPLKVYQRHAPEYAKPSRFPALPHGIVWAVEIVHDGKIVVQGLVDLELNKKLKKWEDGKGRGKHREDPYTMGSLLYGAEISTVPDWYKGKARPGRRK